MTTEERNDPRLRLKRAVIRLGTDIFYTTALLKMRVTCEPRQVSISHIGAANVMQGAVIANGKTVNFHPEFVRHIDDDRLEYYLKKAVLQIALKHNLVGDRYPNAEPAIINLASSLAINFILKDEAGFPDNGEPQAGDPGTFWEFLHPGQTMEHYVDALTQHAEQEAQKRAREQQQKQSQQSNESSEGEGEDSDEETNEHREDGEGGKGEGEDDEQDGGGAGQGEGKDDAEESDEEPEDEGEGNNGEDEPGEDEDDAASPDSQDQDSEGSPDKEEEGEPIEGEDWDDLPKEHVAGSIEQHPDLTNDNGDTLRAEADQDTANAAAAAGIGNTPGILIASVLKPSKLSYRSILRRFCLAHAKHGYTYQRPNRRSAWRRDIILPARRNKGLDKIVLAVDTSGSMTPKMINRAVDEIRAIVTAFPEVKVTMIECDTAIHAEIEVHAYDVDRLKKDGKWYGRGGTDLRPPFARAKEMGGVRCLIYLTDLEGPQPEAGEVDIPTLWLCTSKLEDVRSRRLPKFGEVISIDG